MRDKVDLNDIWHIIDEVISSGGEFRITPNGTSMLPLLRPGVDTIVLVSPQDIKKGDIVLHRRDGGKFILHRVINAKKDNYIICGDNQTSLEYGVQDRHILAKVKDIYRDDEKVDIESKEYKKYVKSQLRKGRRIRYHNIIYKFKK